MTVLLKGWLLPLVGPVLPLVLLATTAQAQQPAVDLYKVRIVTVDGHRIRGVLENIDSSYVYISGKGRDFVLLSTHSQACSPPSQ